MAKMLTTGVLALVFSLQTAIAFQSDDSKPVVLGATHTLTEAEKKLLVEKDLETLRRDARSIGYEVVASDRVIAVLPPAYGAYNKYSLALGLLDVLSQAGIGNRISIKTIPESCRKALNNYINTASVLAPAKQALLSAENYDITPYAQGTINLTYNGQVVPLQISSRAAEGYAKPADEKPIKALQPDKQKSMNPTSEEGPYAIAIYFDKPISDDIEKTQLEMEYFKACYEHLSKLKAQYDRNMKDLSSIIDSANPFGALADDSTVDCLPAKLRSAIESAFKAYASKVGMSSSDADAFLRNAKVNIDRNSLVLGLSFPQVEINDIRYRASTTIKAIAR